MLISTLPDLGGRAFEVRGLVFANAYAGGGLQPLVQQLIFQATHFEADAIVDVKTIMGGDHAHCVMTGTAVKLL